MNTMGIPYTPITFILELRGEKGGMLEQQSYANVPVLTAMFCYMKFTPYHVETISDTMLVKYLGVILDPCLTWNEHIEHIGNKILSRLGMLRRARKVIPKEACITLFNAMVLPLFDYCYVVWDGCGQGNKNYLDRLLKRAAGIIAGRKATDTDIQQTLKWPSLQCRREHQSAYRSISVVEFPRN